MSNSLIARPSLWRSLLDRLIGVILAAGDFLLDDEGNWLLDADGDFRLHNADGACPECCDVFCYQFVDCCEATVTNYWSTVELDTGNQLIEGACGELSAIVCDEPVSGTQIGPGDLTATLDCGDALCPSCPSRTCSVGEDVCCVGDDISITISVTSSVNCTPCVPPDCNETCDCTEETCAAWESYCSGQASGMSGTFALHWDANIPQGALDPFGDTGAWRTTTEVAVCSGGLYEGLPKVVAGCSSAEVWNDSGDDGSGCCFGEPRNCAQLGLGLARTSGTCGSVTLEASSGGGCGFQGTATITWTDPGDCGLP